MVSVASGGRADRIAARILFKVPRAGSGTPARYSSILFGASPAFAADLRVVDLACFMRTTLQALQLQIHDVGARKGSARRLIVPEGLMRVAWYEVPGMASKEGIRPGGT